MDPSLISRWAKDKRELLQLELRSAGKKGSGYVGRVLFSKSTGLKPRFEAAETIVRVKIDQARRQRRPVTARTIKNWMLAAVRETQPAADNVALARQFKASNSWLAGFTRRAGLVVRKPTNKKEVSIDSRLPAIQNFHTKLQAFISLPPYWYTRY